MGEPVAVAVDAMGGDHAPGEAVAGALEAVETGQVHVRLCGPLDVLRETLGGDPPPGVELVDAPETIGYDEDPAFAIRAKQSSSLVVCCREVRARRAAAAVSAGSTGAMMAASLLEMRRIPGVLRPAIAQPLPAQRGPVVLLDCGANPDPRPEHLFQYAYMGSAFASTVLGMPHPRVGLLSIGEEPGKGNELTLAAHQLLAGAEGIDFVGNIEGRDIPLGAVDVVVTDGFTGNVVLKTLEGAGRWLLDEVRTAAHSSLRGKVGGALLQPALRPLRAKVDPDTYGGAFLIGLRGVSVIAHGSSGRAAIRNAILYGARGVSEGVVDQLEARLGRSPAPETA